MNDEMKMKGWSGTKCKPQYSDRMLKVFNLHLSTSVEKASRILRFQTQEKFADIWLLLTIQTAIPVGLCYLTFVCEKNQGNHCNWHKSFKELRLRRVQHYLSSLKEEKTLAVLIPLTLLPKTTTAL
jgi:hypothetical protein